MEKRQGCVGFPTSKHHDAAISLRSAFAALHLHSPQLSTLFISAFSTSLLSSHVCPLHMSLPPSHLYPLHIPTRHIYSLHIPALSHPNPLTSLLSLHPYSLTSRLLHISTLFTFPLSPHVYSPPLYCLDIYLFSPHLENS